MPKKIRRTRRKSINKLVRRSRKKSVRRSRKKSRKNIKGGMFKSLCNGDWCRSENPNNYEQVMKPSKPIYLQPGDLESLDYPVFVNIMEELKKIRTEKSKKDENRKKTILEAKDLASKYDKRIEPVPDPSTYDFGY